MEAEELVTHLVTNHPQVLSCGHVDAGEAGCGVCADERMAERHANERVVAAYEAMCPAAPEPEVGLFGRFLKWLRDERAIEDTPWLGW